MGSWFSSNSVKQIDPIAANWKEVTREFSPVVIYRTPTSAEYTVVAEQGDQRCFHFSSHTNLREAAKSAEQLERCFGQHIKEIHFSTAEEADRLLKHVSAEPNSTPLQTVVHLSMFNKFSDGFSGLKDMVNSQSLGRNQAALHIAVKSNTAFAVNQLLNAGADTLAKDETGNTPLHAAAFNGCNFAMEALLIHPSVARIKGEMLESVNNEGDSALHLACKGSIEHRLLIKIQSQAIMGQAPQVLCLNVLLEHGADVKVKNSAGQTPLQCAVMSPDADVHCVDALLEHDCNLVHVVDEDGNSLLHHARGNKVVQCLVHHGIDIKLTNKLGQTALHKAIHDTETALDQVMSLVLNGVDVDLLDEDGNTALHCLAKLPAKKGSVRENLIKALVVLGADLNSKNTAGQTVYEAAKEAGCRSTMTLLTAVGADDNKYLTCKSYPELAPEVLEAASSDTTARKLPNWNRNNAAVLSLDGGGIRGLVLIQMLLDIERRTGLQITQLFDWVGGTSTGGMVALALIFAKMSLRDCQKLYFGLKDEVFKGSRPYNTEILEDFLKEKYSEDSAMSSVPFPRCLVPTTIADCRPCKLHVFKNYGFRAENNCPAPYQQKVWEAARSSSAAPTYFTPHKRFVDGGLMANNPTITMLTELHECNQDLGKLGHGESATPVSFTDGLVRAVVGDEFTMSEAHTGCIESRPVNESVPTVKDVKEEPTKPYVVVSLGTGLPPEVMVKDYNVSKVDGPLGAGRFLMGVKEIVETLVEQCAGTDGAVVLGAKAWCESIGSYYFRLQPQLSYNMKLDETENLNLVECLWDVQCFIYERRTSFERIVDLLMSAFSDTDS